MSLAAVEWTPRASPNDHQASQNRRTFSRTSGFESEDEEGKEKSKSNDARKNTFSSSSLMFSLRWQNRNVGRRHRLRSSHMCVSTGMCVALLSINFAESSSGVIRTDKKRRLTENSFLRHDATAAATVERLNFAFIVLLTGGRGRVKKANLEWKKCFSKIFSYFSFIVV